MNDHVSAAAPPMYRAVSFGRVRAMVLRYLYLVRSSWPRLLELVYWPLLQLLTWGFLQTYISRQTGWAASAGVFLGGVLLWEVLARAQLGFNLSFLEEMWSRNLANLLISPLTRAELVLSLVVMSFIRVLISIVPLSLLAMVFFDYELWGLGFALIGFFVNLLFTGWALATLTSGVVLRYGLGAEGLIWSAMIVLMPLCAVFYPASVLPSVLRWIAWSLPPTYVFEGLRAIVLERTFRADLMVAALAINGVLIGIATVAFSKLLDSARRAGTLMSVGE